MGPGTIRLPRLGARGAHRVRAAGALLAGALFVPTGAAAQSVPSDTATAKTQAVFLTPGSVAKTRDMNFGNIAPGAVAGTVVLTPAQVAVCTASAPLVRSGTCTSARFAIRGKRNNRVRIRQNNGGTVTLNGPSGATMTLTNLTFDSTGMSAANGGNGWDFGNWRIDAVNGITAFWVGGTLHVGAAQAPGVYSGTLVIQIQFN
jgi:hypothetical protein